MKRPILLFAILAIFAASPAIATGGDTVKDNNVLGQLQGQIGINALKNAGNNTGNSRSRSSSTIGDIIDGDVSTSTRTGTRTRTDQGQSQGQDNDVQVIDRSSHDIDNDFPVNTAAPVFAGNCSQGVSAQTMSFGGAIASGNPVCDYIAVAGAYIAGGNREMAFSALEKAENYADWRAVWGKVRMCITFGLL
jgi:hypothetical protein